MIRRFRHWAMVCCALGIVLEATALVQPNLNWGLSEYATLKRTGTAASDVYVAYGPTHGGTDRSAWAHFEKLTTGFAADQTSLAVTLPGIDETSFKYLRFYSVADGWSDSAFAPDTKRCFGFGIIIR